MTEHLKEIMDGTTEVYDTLTKMNGEIRDLDEEVNRMLDVTKEKTLLYIRNQKRLGRDAKLKAAKEINSLYNDIHERAQKKAQIATEMYDFIDGRIRDLDKRTNQFNMKMFKSAANEQKKLAGGSTASGGSGVRGDRKRKNEDNKKSRREENADFLAEFKPLQLESMDMPVNPNEPRYCICHQVSFGEMIACDNPTCKYEWFHYQCLGITKAPPGEFICDYCKGNSKIDNKKKR